MTQATGYLEDGFENAVIDIIAGIDRDIERGEDILMSGLGIVVMSTFLAPLIPPAILLPLVALTFAVSAGLARKNYHNIERKLTESIGLLGGHDKSKLYPITDVFTKHPVPLLAESLNPLKNMQRTIKSTLGGILINPFWAPIFYMMGLQINEEKNLALLNKALINVEQNISTSFSILI